MLILRSIFSPCSFTTIFIHFNRPSCIASGAKLSFASVCIDSFETFSFDQNSLTRGYFSIPSNYYNFPEIFRVSEFKKFSRKESTSLIVWSLKKTVVPKKNEVQYAANSNSKHFYFSILMSQRASLAWRVRIWFPTPRCRFKFRAGCPL